MSGLCQHCQQEPVFKECPFHLGLTRNVATKDGIKEQLYDFYKACKYCYGVNHEECGKEAWI